MTFPFDTVAGFSSGESRAAASRSPISDGPLLTASELTVRRSATIDELAYSLLPFRFSNTRSIRICPQPWHCTRRRTMWV